MIQAEAKPGPAILLLCLLLPLYGNLVALADRYLFPQAPPFPAFLGALTTVTLVLWAVHRQRVSLAELGFHRHGAVRSGFLGILIGVALAAAAVASLQSAPLMQGPVRYTPITAMSAESLLLRVLVTMPLDTIILEEVAFRGVLLAVLLRSFSTNRAVLFSSLLFMLWHLLLNFHTLFNSSLAEEPQLLALGLLGAHVAVFMGAFLFCMLRLRLGHIAPCITAHWTVNAGILVGLYWLTG